MQFNAGLTVPKTVAELMELISELRSRKSVYQMFIGHVRICYQKSDSGPAEMKITREDLGIVPESHIEKTVLEIEERINFIDAQIEELQGQPIGGGTPPVAEAAPATNAPTPEQAPATPTAPAPEAQGSVLQVGAGPGQPPKTAEKKEVPSGKPKPPGGRPS